MFRYVHIPFCRRRCLYCRFALTTKWDGAALARYAAAVVAEIRKEAENTVIPAPEPGSPAGCRVEPGMTSCGSAKSVYFGGGTPSVMPPGLLGKIMAAFRETGIEPGAEITLEANPEDVTPEALRAWADLGVNRLSLGIQSFEKPAHDEVWRVFADPDALLKTVDAGPIKNVNLDFIVGLPKSPAGSLAPNLSRLLARFPVVKHCSVYLLEDEKYPEKWKESSVPAEKYAEEYAAAKAALEGAGLARYEISNFAKPGFGSRHNRAYWDRAEYRGYGLSAESLVGGERFGNAKTFADYYAGKEAYRERLSPEQERLERIMTGLRTFSCALSDVGDRAGLDRALREGLAELNGDSVRPTETGVQLLDRLAGMLA